jgi:hypothetical protein
MSVDIHVALKDYGENIKTRSFQPIFISHGSKVSVYLFVPFIWRLSFFAKSFPVLFLLLCYLYFGAFPFQVVSYHMFKIRGKP